LPSSSATARPIPRLPPDTTAPHPVSSPRLLMGVGFGIHCASTILDGLPK
jgi:hypothetical protein